ncbi:MAG TPA: ABC transporter permease [Porphyromonadaceae bacterium]|jgi:phospholipid/cholesterol/gamma-HCH transport system permease protein|uniref:MlaE family ABC transporter permease n=1 Tax=Limibacterium fermenti TaxID=3229863 RepID=UPI000E8C4554|nr:ABC transporter permease [Porphyromonadaceae bacterium]HBK30140.1 ABC transporter permease [Porphyromonadaceae bacterium]HBL34790.1 ABC transporter permease [Porphyromonadaceae bacterium]HBX21432.1 ABC transporter permease [Porphyromonadaceae bacterium]HBX44942.1 ABC transporter permease [Porphyromonadaceae bacterium]
MSFINSIESIGEYALLVKKVIAVPDRFREFFKEFFKEVYKLGVNSIWIVMVISFFIGAVIVMQIALNVASPLLPRFTVGVVSREIILLEFSSTIMCLILSGKVGSNIASEIGTMRVTEQIDALDIMGVNSANYLILPKITAFVAFMPVLVIFSMFMGLFGGYIICAMTGTPPVATYVYGVQSFFRESFVWYSMVKSMIFGFIIASVAAYFGYTAKGGALEVGKASTDSVVINSILILMTDLVFTQLVMG